MLFINVDHKDIMVIKNTVVVEIMMTTVITDLEL